MAMTAITSMTDPANQINSEKVIVEFIHNQGTVPLAHEDLIHPPHGCADHKGCQRHDRTMQSCYLLEISMF